MSGVLGADVAWSGAAMMSWMEMVVSAVVMKDMVRLSAAVTSQTEIAQLELLSAPEGTTQLELLSTQAETT